MTLGSHIAYLRNARGLSQADLAEAMDVSRQSVSKWETGASTPDLEKLVRMADYFHLTLDQLVNGCEAEMPEPSIPSNQREPDTAQPIAPRTRAKSVGLFFLCVGACAAIVLAILFGLFGVLLAVPFVLFGLICCFAEKHPILKASWASYILVSLVLHYGTGLNPSGVLLTFRWTEQMNYGILLFDWIWFAAVMALMIGTAAALHRQGWSWTPKQSVEFAVGCASFVLSYFLVTAANASFWTYLLSTYLRLAGLSILVTDLTRWVFSRKRSGNGQEPEVHEA